MRKLPVWKSWIFPPKPVEELHAPVKPKPAISGLITLYHRNNTMTQYNVWFDNPTEATSIKEHDLWQRVERWFGASTQDQPLVVVSLTTSSTSMFDRSDIVRVELTDTSTKESE